jgi:hypothetical protein
LTKFCNAFDMVNGAVVEDEDTVWGRVRVHFLAKPLDEFKKRVAIEGADLDATIDYTT